MRLEINDCIEFNNHVWVVRAHGKIQTKLKRLGRVVCQGKSTHIVPTIVELEAVWLSNVALEKAQKVYLTRGLIFEKGSADGGEG